MQKNHLVKAAEIIIENMQTPANFLSFLIEAQRWYDSFKTKYPPKDTAEDCTYNISHFMEAVIIPWIKNEKDPVVSVSDGLTEVWDMAGHEGYYMTCSAIMQAFGHEMNCGIPSAAYYQKFLNGINTLIEVSYYIGDYELEKRKAA